MSELNVTATRWEGGWELEIGPDQHTSVRSLAKARQQVVDFLDTVTPEVNHSTWTINIIPCLGGLEQAVRAAKQSTVQAAWLSANAARGTAYGMKLTYTIVYCWGDHGWSS